MTTEKPSTSIPTITSSTSGADLGTLPQLLTLVPTEIATTELDPYLGKFQRIADRSRTPSGMGPIVKVFDKSSIKWQGGIDHAAYLKNMQDAIELHKCTQPIVKLGVRRLIETEEWMPSISKVLNTCKAVHNEVLSLIRQIERRHTDEVLAVRQVDREMRDLMPEAVAVALESAEYRLELLESRRRRLARDRAQLTEYEQVRARHLAGLRRSYEGSPYIKFYLGYANQLQANDKQEFAAEWEAIKVREDELARLEAQYAQVEYEPKLQLQQQETGSNRPHETLSN